MMCTRQKIYRGIILVAFSLQLQQGGLVYADNLGIEQEEIDIERNAKTEMQNLQKVKVHNNDVVFVTISEKELTRFIFNGDKVKHIYAISGEISYDLVDENLYLKPNVIKPINFFVMTEKGKTYQVLAEPRDIPATQVMILGTSGDASIAKKSKENLVHDNLSSDSILMREIRKIVLAIKSSDKTLGYRIKEINKTIKNERGGIVSTLESRWSNDEITAEKHHLTNTTNRSVILSKANYLVDGVVAVYLDKNVVDPNESTLLILLKRARSRYDD